MCSWKGVVVLTFVDLAAVNFWQGARGGWCQEWDREEGGTRKGRSETEEREGASMISSTLQKPPSPPASELVRGSKLSSQAHPFS